MSATTIQKFEKGRKPDYRVKALDKKLGVKGEIGAAWANEDHSISVILDNFIVLEQNGNLLITLFPIDKTQ